MLQCLHCCTSQEARALHPHQPPSRLRPHCATISAGASCTSSGAVHMLLASACHPCWQQRQLPGGPTLQSQLLFPTLDSNPQVELGFNLGTNWSGSTKEPVYMSN